MTQVIDLGEMPREQPDTVAEPRRPGELRPLLAALSVVLLVLLAGAVPWPRNRPPILVPARLGDSMFLVEDRMFLVGGTTSVGEARRREVSTYELPAVRFAGRTTVVVSGSVNQVLLAGSTMLVSYQVDASGTWAVVAVAAGTDRTLWRRTARLVGVSEADGLVLLGTDREEIVADLATGRVGRTVARPANGYIAETGWTGSYPRWLVMLTDDGVLQARDARTGDIVAARPGVLPRNRQNGLLWPVDDLVMVDDGTHGPAAYRLPGLTPLWHTGADLSRSWMQDGCGRLICAFQQQNGMIALDPATGRELWHSELWAYAEPVGDYLLAVRAEGVPEQGHLTVLDPATGHTLGDFGRWDYLGPAPGGKFYGKIDVRGEYVVHYGVLDPAARSVRLLGTAGEVSNSCQTAAGLLICRLIDASVALWPLR